MSILIKNTWQPVIDEIWNSLLSAPDYVFVELLRYYYKVNGIDLTEKSDILNDISLAREEFHKITPPNSELDCLKILQGFYETLLESFGTVTADEYFKSLTKIFDLHNLRYTITSNKKIALSLQGLLDSLLLRLRKTIKHERSKLEGLELLEASVANLDNSDITTRTCLTNANNLLESAVVDKTSNNEKTLTKALNGCVDLFPFQTLYDSLSNISQFLNDYPNLRHAGDRSKKLKDLKLDDATLIAALAISYASYIRSFDDGNSVINGDF